LFHRNASSPVFSVHFEFQSRINFVSGGLVLVSAIGLCLVTSVVDHADLCDLLVGLLDVGTGFVPAFSDLVLRDDVIKLVVPLLFISCCLLLQASLFNGVEFL